MKAWVHERYDTDRIDIFEPCVQKRAIFLPRIYTHHSWHSYALEGSGGILPRKIVKSRSLNDAFYTIFRPKYGSFFVFVTLEGGWGCAPSGSATGFRLLKLHQGQPLTLHSLSVTYRYICSFDLIYMFMYKAVIDMKKLYPDEPVSTIYTSVFVGFSANEHHSKNQWFYSYS